MSRTDFHNTPTGKDLIENAQFEPEGERIRKELIEFLDKHKIVSIYLDTERHTVIIRSATLPPKMKSVLSSWGSIFVLDESPNELEGGADAYCWVCAKTRGTYVDGEKVCCKFCQRILGVKAAAWEQPERPADWNDNVIPPMTHPMARGWSQPDTALITIDSNTARMPNAVFTRLAEYSSSVPSGVYEGKMWKSHVLWEGKDFWLLRWFGYGLLAGCVSEHARHIVLTDGELTQ